MEKEALDIFQPVFWRIQQQRRIRKSQRSLKVDGEEAGTIHKSEGKGVFAEAVDGVTASKGEPVDGVKVGTPVAVSSDASLVPLGTFKITHYCPCSICCGPWANGITSTGVTATTTVRLRWTLHRFHMDLRL